MAKKTPPKKKAAKKAAPKKKTAVKKKAAKKKSITITPKTHRITQTKKGVTITPLFASESTLVEGAEPQAWERGESIGATADGDAIQCEKDTSGE